MSLPVDMTGESIKEGSKKTLGTPMSRSHEEIFKTFTNGIY
ncbi:MAG: hypothetical protein Q4C95_00525 [Planctomycetia bacterium]|nr:hypothetical protein [Planctomycetia bacterium]